MTSETLPTLDTLEFIPYLNDQGQIPSQFEGKIGVYAIFESNKTLQFIGYSRDVGLSLKQHLVRQPHQCYWVKFQTIERPNRTVLENIRDAWIAENGTIPPGNAVEEPQWNQAIDAKASMTDAEKAAYAAGDDISRVKLLKQTARRVEEQVLVTLQQRGVQMPLRFDPKLKEEGLLNLK